MFKSENELIDSESIAGDSFETIALSNTKGFRECAATAIGVPGDKVVGDGFEIHRGDAMELIKDIQSASVHLIAIDPPYFIDGMGSGWNREKLETKVSRANVVGRLPVGMQFNPKQGRDFERFMAPLAKEARVGFSNRAQSSSSEAVNSQSAMGPGSRPKRPTGNDRNISWPKDPLARHARRMELLAPADWKSSETTSMWRP